MFKSFVAGAVIALLTGPALAGGNCAARELVIERLQDKFSEHLTVGGLQDTKPVETLIEVWSSKETGTFTVLLTNPSGVSCIVAAGTDFFSQPVPDTTDSAPS